MRIQMECFFYTYVYMDTMTVFAAEHNLEDARTLQDYHIQVQSTLHVAEAPLELPSGRVVSHVYFANKRRRLCEKLHRVAMSERVAYWLCVPRRRGPGGSKLG